MKLIKNGNRGRYSTGNPNNDNVPDWPSYDVSKRATMLFGKETKVVNRPFDKERAVWDDIIWFKI